MTRDLSPLSDSAGPPGVAVKVGIFEAPRKRSVSLRAYTIWYNPKWAGCCEHQVVVTRRRDAKIAAMAEHRARCMVKPA